MVALFVAIMFVGLVLTDLAVEKWQAWRAAHPAQAKSPRAEALRHGHEAWCHLPEGVHLASQHTWLRPNPTGGLEMGADALLVRAVGAICRIILPKVGDQVTVGQPLFRLEHNGCAVTVPSAMTGRVMAINDRLGDDPGLLSSDPYGKGWICALSPTRVEAAAPRVRIGEQAVMWLENEFARFHDFIFAQAAPDLALGLTSQDGGIPSVGCLTELDAEAWTAFEADFLCRP
jgi:glycine cleavage system H protein